MKQKATPHQLPDGSTVYYDDDVNNIRDWDFIINLESRKIMQALPNVQFEVSRKVVAQSLNSTIKGVPYLWEEDEVEALAEAHAIKACAEYISENPIPAEFPKERHANLMRLFRIQSKKDFIAGIKASHPQKEFDEEQVREAFQAGDSHDIFLEDFISELRAPKPIYIDTTPFEEDNKMFVRKVKE